MTHRFLYLFISCLMVWTQQLASQTIPVSKETNEVAVATLLQLFTQTHGLEFSYDVARMSTSYITYSGQELSFEDLKQEVKRIGITIEQDAANTYLVQKEDEVFPFCAQILESASKLPVPNVQVYSGGIYIGLTDFSGEIHLDLSLGQRIQLTSAGLQEKYHIVYPQVGCSSIFLKDNIEELEEVILTNYLTRGIVKNKNSSITVSPQSLAILPGLVEPDVFQSLQLVPGINSPEEDPASLHIRGGTPDQNLLLWDGIRLYQNSHFFDQLTSFNPYITKKVDVYRGGTSVRFGDRISGVVDIHSDDDLFTDVKAGGGINALSGDAYVKIPLSRKFGILFATRRSLTDLYRSFTFNRLSDKVFQNSRLERAEEEDLDSNVPLNYFFSDTNLKLMYKTDAGHTYTASFINIANELENEAIGISNQNEFEIDDNFTQDNWGASLRWHREKEGKTTKGFDLSYSVFKSDYKLKFSDDDNQNAQLTTERLNTIRELNTDLSYDIPFGKRHHWLLGQQYSFTNIRYTSSDIITTTTDSNVRFFEGNGVGRTTIIGYTGYRYDGNKLLLNIGVRGEANSLIGTYLEPRIFGSFKLTNPWRLTASLERKNQTFSQIDASQVEPTLYNILPAASRFWGIQAIGGPFRTNFVLQRSNQFTFGTLFKKNGWDIEIEGYYKQLENTFPQNDTFLSGIYTLENRLVTTTGEARRYGVDLLLKKRIGKYRAWASYTYSKNNVQYDDIQDEAFPESFDQRHRFNISQTYSYNRFEFALGWTYGSGLPVTRLSTGTVEDIATIRANNRINADRLRAFHRLDASTNYHFKNKGRWNGKVGISLRNLYGRSSSISERYSVLIDDDLNLSLTSQSNNSLDFTANVVCRISF